MPNHTVQAATEGLPVDRRRDVERLVNELRGALAACGVGPLRAIVDGDGPAVIQDLIGSPMVNGHRLGGIHLLMTRTTVGPQLPLRPIPVEAGR